MIGVADRVFSYTAVIRAGYPRPAADRLLGPGIGLLELFLLTAEQALLEPIDQLEQLVDARFQTSQIILGHETGIGGGDPFL